MRTIFFPVAAIMAATSSALYDIAADSDSSSSESSSTELQLAYDTQEPVFEDSICCYLYAQPDYLYDVKFDIPEEDRDKTFDGDRNYSKIKKCLKQNLWGEFMISPYSFIEQIEGGGHMMDNMESYKCGSNVAMEMCNYAY